MSWVMPEAWADAFDPPLCDWVVWQGPMGELFPGVAERGWRGELVQRDFWVRKTGFGRDTLVVEWSAPWREVISITRNGYLYYAKPSTLKEFDRLWR